MNIRYRFLKLIWAQSCSGVLSSNNTIPWHLIEDLIHFKRITLRQAILMGRKTWESIPFAIKPLTNRHNFIVTKNPKYSVKKVYLMSNIDTLFQGWIIGGAQIFLQCLPFASRCEVTEVNIDLLVINNFLLAPKLGIQWKKVARHWIFSSTGVCYRFCSYLYID